MKRYIPAPTKPLGLFLLALAALHPGLFAQELSLLPARGHAPVLRPLSRITPSAIYPACLVANGYRYPATAYRLPGYGAEQEGEAPPAPQPGIWREVVWGSWVGSTAGGLAGYLARPKDPFAKDTRSKTVNTISGAVTGFGVGALSGYIMAKLKQRRQLAKNRQAALREGAWAVALFEL